MTQPEFTFPPESFYQIIIDNNQTSTRQEPSRKREPYVLLGTLIPKHRKTAPQVLVFCESKAKMKRNHRELKNIRHLQATATNTTHIVTIGEKLDADTKVANLLK